MWHEVRQPISKYSAHCNNNKCDHICVVSKSSYTCLCGTDRILSDDDHSCEGFYII